ncbi:MAG: glycosyltransferase [Acidobacteria bacterium]|nr:glycosyltransferase [Acidobacteriota bacterium]
MQITLVIMTKNERQGAEAIFPSIPFQAVDRALVVDAGSKDGTIEFFRQKGIPVVIQQRPGLGGGVLEARQAVSEGAMIFFHPDGNEAPEDIPEFVRLLRTGFDFVVASRMIPGSRNEEDGRLLKPRKWTNLGLAWIARVCWPSNNGTVTDVVNGFRAITCAAFDRLKLDRLDCTIDYQMVIRAQKEKIRICEFPTQEGRRIAGETNFKSIPTGLAELRMLSREIWLGRRYR